MEINKSINLNCSPEDLWPWLNEFERVKQWNKSILDEKHISSGEVRKGFLTKVLINEETSQSWYNSEITKYEPCSNLSFQLSGEKMGKHPMKVEYKLISNGHQTTLKYNSSWIPHGFMLKMLVPVIKKVANKNIEDALKKLEALLNASKG